MKPYYQSYRSLDADDPIRKIHWKVAAQAVAEWRAREVEKAKQAMEKIWNKAQPKAVAK